MSSLEQINNILSEILAENTVSNMALIHLLMKESETVELEKAKELLGMNLYLPEEELEVRKMVEDLAANNTAGVEVKNPDAVPKKKKTVKDLLARRA